MAGGTTPEAKYAVVRGVAETFDRCVRTYSEKEAVNIELAKKQHESYCKALEQRKLELIRVPVENAFPDCVFVEDAAVVYKQKAIICNMGAKSRTGEVEGVRRTLGRIFNRIESVRAPATIDGGDVLRVKDDLFVGITSRTNMDGVKQLKHTLRNERCSVTPVKVERILHFKSVCSYIGDDYVVVNPGYFDLKVLSSLKLISLPRKESYAANCLAVNGTVFISKGYPQTKKMIEKEGFGTKELDVSEFKKCEGSLTCLSIIF